jgi:hypothetical protein
VQRAHGADTLAELFEKAGFGIGIFGHVSCSALAAKARIRKHNAEKD